jgi:hypothetical protein
LQVKQENDIGYSTAFLMVEGLTTAEAMDLFNAADMFAPAGSQIGFEEAFSLSLDPNMAVGDVKGWAVFWNGSGQILRSEFPAEVSRGRRSLGCQLISGDSQYGFSYFVNGALRRSIVYELNAVLDEVGLQLSEEIGFAVAEWGPDEDFVFGVMERLTGISLGDLQEASYRVLEFLG